MIVSSYYSLPIEVEAMRKIASRYFGMSINIMCHLTVENQYRRLAPVWFVADKFPTLNQHYSNIHLVNFGTKITGLEELIPLKPFY